MKKIILLGLIAIGVGVAGASAQAGGIPVFRPPFVPVLLPPPPIFVPAFVAPRICPAPVVVYGADCGGYYRVGRFARVDRREDRREDRRDVRVYRHDRF